jgi:hypothetical protein
LLIHTTLRWRTCLISGGNSGTRVVNPTFTTRGGDALRVYRLSGANYQPPLVFLEDSLPKTPVRFLIFRGLEKQLPKTVVGCCLGVVFSKWMADFNGQTNISWVLP